MSCVRDQELPGPDTKGTDAVQEKAFIVNKSTGARKGELLVKFREKAADSVRAMAGTRSVSGHPVSGLKAVDNVMRQVGAVRIERVFPYSGRFEKRTRESGLDRWYKITFDEELSLDDAAGRFADLGELKVVQFNVPVKRVNDFKSVPVEIAEAGPVNSPRPTATEYPFNDPMLPNQWHYNNDGSVSGSKAGADINVFKAWKEFTAGSPDVIVTVVDEGAQYDHPDLKDNIWINEAELNGQPGVDDDGNGYIDDIYGFDFYEMRGKIDPGEHGSHTSGTIAAVNNNNVGVCGVAGGDGTRGGVKIQSCGIFPSWTDYAAASTENTLKALKYGADNGAVISQNSWGWSAGYYNSENAWSDATLEKDGIDYFIKYAGYDADDNGNSVYVGPLDGGLIVFAAGNDGDWARDAKSYPAAYGPVLSVASMAVDFSPAYYTCYGSWVDVTAPGGDAYNPGGDVGQVLSTINRSSYAYFQGTSMACPHVSGIAALAVSYAHELGLRLTSAELKKIIEENTNDIDQYLNNTYKGKMGSGYVDAYKVLQAIDNMGGTRNRAPELSLADGQSPDIKLFYYENAGIRFNVSDPEGDQWTAVLEDPDGLLTPEQSGNTLTLSVQGSTTNAGEHTAVVWVKDSEDNESNKITVTYTIIPNQAPKATGTMDDVAMSAVGQTGGMNVAPYFTDQSDELTYSAEAVVAGTRNPSEAVKAVLDGSNLTYTSMKYGQAQVRVTATDREGLSATQSFMVTVRNGSVAVEMYPNPVTDWLYIRMGTDVNGSIGVKIYNGSGANIWSGTASISPQNPARLNMSNLAKGRYVVEVTHGGKTYKESIVKS